jgi:hypothetical protein
MRDDWNTIDQPPPTKRQRHALHKFAMPDKVIHAMTPSEAAVMLDVLVGVAKRQARRWNEAANSAEDLLA